MAGHFATREGQRFDGQRVLLDPTARAIAWRPTWCHKDVHLATPRGQLIAEDFDWGDDRPLQLPLEDLVIYEMHVRGFTAHPSSGVRTTGTFAGIVEKIPYLKELGINCVELMPVFEFDEFENSRVAGENGELL